MKEFFVYFFDQWWGIAAVSVIGAALLIALSALFYRAFFKRFYDFVLSFTALAVLFPLMLVLALTGAVVLKGNPFFVQLRPGKNCKIFRLIKFRTMSNKKDEQGNYLPDEERLGRYGRFLRGTSADELPELLNILCGKMSLVGPRPQLVKDMVFMDEQALKRHTVRQGLTGLAQVSGRNSISWEEKFAYDLKYVENITFFGDIKIIFKTVFKVFARKDITAQGMETAENYGDYLLRTGKIDKEEYDKKIAEAKSIEEQARG